MRVRFLALLVFFVASSLGMASGDVPPVIINYFYEPGCPDCVRVREQVLPELAERFETFYRLNRYDVSTKTNVIRLIAYQEVLNVTSNESVRHVVEIALTLILVVLSVLSFRDALRYAKTGNAAAVSLQLPDGIKKRIHTIVRKGLKARSLVLGGLVVGVLVTALESVCTGQVYVPTLALVTKETGMTKAWTYLLLYNAMFITPLIVVFVLTYLGLSTEALIGWSKKNVVVSKILLALFFGAMAALMLVL